MTTKPTTTAAEDAATLQDLQTRYRNTKERATKVLELYALEHDGRSPPKARSKWIVNPATLFRLHLGRPDESEDPSTIKLWGIPVDSSTDQDPGDITLQIQYQHP